MQKRREEHFDENHDFFGFSDFETHFLGKFSSKFWFLSLISSRSRRNLASREERIQKFIHTAFFWSVEVGKILMHFLIVKRDHEDRGGPEAGNLQQQFKYSENFAFIFQIRKQQETRKN